MSDHTQRFESAVNSLNKFDFGEVEGKLLDLPYSVRIRSGEDSDPMSKEFRYCQFLSYLLREHDESGTTLNVHELRIYEQPDGGLLAFNSHGVVEDLILGNLIRTRINTPYETGTIPDSAQSLAVESTLHAIEQQLAILPN